jgi:predicted nucleotidyltransferase
VDKRSVLEIISALRNVLESKGIKADKPMLLGSYSKGNCGEDSGIDIVVISRDFNNKSYW